MFCTLAFIGFIILLLGIVTSQQKSKYIQQPIIQQPEKSSVQKPLFYCRECGKPIYKNSKYCENCVTEFVNI